MLNTTGADPNVRLATDESVAGGNDPAALDRLFDQWMRDDESEQRETFECLRRGLDRERPAGYQLFA